MGCHKVQIINYIILANDIEAGPFLHQRMSSIRNCLVIEHIWRGFGYLSSEERRKWSNNGEARKDIARWQWMSQRSDPTLTSGRNLTFQNHHPLQPQHDPQLIWSSNRRLGWFELTWLPSLPNAHPHVLCWSHSSKGQLQVGGGLIGKKSTSVSSFIDIRQRTFSLNWLNEGRGCALHQIWSHFMPRLFGGNTPPPHTPTLVQSRQIKWAEQFLQGLAMSKGPNRPTLNPTQMKITKFFKEFCSQRFEKTDNLFILIIILSYVVFN